MVLECRRILIKFGIWFVLEFLRFTVNYQNWQSVWILKPNKLPRTATSQPASKTRSKYHTSSKKDPRKSVDSRRDNNGTEKENQWLIYWGRKTKELLIVRVGGTPSKHRNRPDHDDGEVIARGQIPPN